MKNLTLAMFLALAPGCMCTTVDPGLRGVKVTFGEMDSTLLGEGFHWKSPFAEVERISVRQYTQETKAEAFSSDLQHINVKLQILFRIPESSVLTVYQKYSGSVFDTLITPRTQEALKEVTSSLTSEQIVKSREEVKQKTLALTREKIGTLLVIEDVVIEDIALSAQLQGAIEAKMVQEQETAKAKFVQQKASIDAETSIIQARGEAESIKIRGDALRQNPKVIEMKMVEKWDGRAPLVTGGNGGSSMILPLDALKNRE